MAPMAPSDFLGPAGGREPAASRPSLGAQGPMAPPPNLIQLVSLVDLLVFLLMLLVNLLMFWDWIACKLIT